MNNKTTYSLNYRNSDDCIIRHTTTADIPRLKEIFAIARRFMAEAGNPNQWTEGYPSEELLQEDIDSGDSYVIVKGDRIVATFVLRGGATLPTTSSTTANGLTTIPTPLSTASPVRAKQRASCTPPCSMPSPSTTTSASIHIATIS